MEFITLEELQDLYDKMQDDLSKKIFIDRLAFSAGEGHEKATRKLILDNEYVKPLILESIKKQTVVIFGAGKIGKRIAELFPEINVKCFIDNCVNDNKINETDVYPSADYIKNNLNDTYVITPKNDCKVIEEQLVAEGVKKENIINIGSAFNLSEERQYFDLQYIEWENEEYFLDCGCFDGVTDKILARIIGERLKKVYAFEPMAENIDKCKTSLESIGCEYKLINKGVWDKETNTYFYLAQHGQYVMTEEYNSDAFEAPVTSLDIVLLKEKITFIKMDIEGAEMHALKGACNIIRTQKPKLAICVYHMLDDFYQIPKYILSLNPEYKLYLRHYGSNASETVLYALP